METWSEDQRFDYLFLKTIEHVSDGSYDGKVAGSWPNAKFFILSA